MCHSFLHRLWSLSRECILVIFTAFPSLPLSNSKAGLEGLIKEFSLSVTARLKSSWSYFSSSFSFASHVIKSSLKAPGWLGFWWGIEDFFKLILRHPKKEQRTHCLRRLGPAALWHILQASHKQLPRLRCLIKKLYSSFSFLTWFRNIAQLNEEQMV